MYFSDVLSAYYAFAEYFWWRGALTCNVEGFVDSYVRCFSFIGIFALVSIGVHYNYYDFIVCFFRVYCMSSSGELNGEISRLTY